MPKPAQHRERRPTETEALLLKVLVGGEKYGLELRDAYEASTKKKLPLGSVYTTLDRMEAKGFVESWYSDTHADDGGRGGHRRRYFKITGQGARALDAFRAHLSSLSKVLAPEPGGAS